MTVRFIREAKLEFLDAMRYYEESEPGLAKRFRLEIEKTIHLLCEYPEIYRLRAEGFRRVNLKTFPYYLPFIIRKETIWILAIAHESRRPRYWISRRLPVLPENP